MNILMRFIMTLLANLAWQRIGGKGGVPPVRLPRSKQPVNIPVLTPWQMMAAMWVARRFWGRFGPQVKSKIDAVNHPAARQVGAWLPDPGLTTSANNSPSAPAPRTWTTTAQPATSPSQGSTKTASAAAQPAPATPKAAPARNYGTQRLDDDAAPDTNRKSVFSGWKRSSQS